MMKLRSVAVCLLVVAVTIAGPGCPRTNLNNPNNISETKEGRVTVLISAANNSLSQALLEAVSPKAVVAADEIYSLTLTVTEISLERDEEDDDSDHHGHRS